MTPGKEPPSIYVIAGTNGAGKSSVAGAAIRDRGSDYFNPDEATRRILEANPGIDPGLANSQAWIQGKQLLEQAISSRTTFTFETTLGGNTIPALLERASAAGLALRMWYVGLEGPDLHIARVRSRVAAGGHDIPEAKIHERYQRSRANLIRLLPALTDLRVFDNSAPGDPKAGILPKPRLILSVRDGVIEETCGLTMVPEWAKPVFMAALHQYQHGIGPTT
jgi:predicted ABC-type ATPase